MENCIGSVEHFKNTVFQITVEYENVAFGRK